MKRKNQGPRRVLGFELKSWVQGAQAAGAADIRKNGTAFVLYFKDRDVALLKKALKPLLHSWQMDFVLKNEADAHRLDGKTGPVWIFRPPAAFASSDHGGWLDRSPYARARDQVGSVVAQLSAFQGQIDRLVLEFHGATPEEERGALIGLEMGAYSYAENRPQVPKSPRRLPRLFLRKGLSSLKPAEIRTAGNLGVAVNLARHLVNVPGGELNPTTYAQAIRSLFEGSDSVKVDVWNRARLEKEKCGLLLAVGQSSRNEPCLVHLRYRPSGGGRRKPIAFIGKGITFDTGGLDIKPSSGMRLMKKDMGGSAAVAALAWWLDQTQVSQPCDLYLALAENAIDANSIRPGDVITARNGMAVEIHNTDAEGRLVLADAMDVAVKQKGADEPELLIDVATLTGAIKVGLGAEVAGLFANRDELATEILEASQSSGDLCWRMPLYQPYRSSLRSTFADVVNAGDGFGGAITAALFLQSFSGGKPWAHLDIYAWKDGAAGACSEAGGNGQPVQALAEWLQRRSEA